MPLLHGWETKEKTMRCQSRCKPDNCLKNGDRECRLTAQPKQKYKMKICSDCAKQGTANCNVTPRPQHDCCAEYKSKQTLCDSCMNARPVCKITGCSKCVAYKPSCPTCGQSMSSIEKRIKALISDFNGIPTKLYVGYHEYEECFYHFNKKQGHPMRSMRDCADNINIVMGLICHIVKEPNHLTVA